MNNEQLKKLHKEKNTKAINENLYKANIKLVDMNRYLKIDIENLKQEIERLNNIINKVLFILEHLEDDRVGYEACIELLKGSDKE